MHDDGGALRESNTNRARPAGPEDIAALGSLMIAFYAEAQFSLARLAAEQTFAALLAAPAMGQVWLLESDGQAAGFIVLTVSFSMEYGGLRGFVDDFFVAQPYRRRGLGSFALEAVKEDCAVAACARCWLKREPPTQPR